MKAVFTLLLFTGFTIAAKADTIDYWHVYYNDKKLTELTYNADKTITIKASQIKDNDSIRVFFFREAPCSECETSLTVNDNNDARVATSKGRGTGKALSFSLADVLLYKRRTGKNTFEVCYFDRLNMYQAMKPIIFTIKLE